MRANQIFAAMPQDQAIEFLQKVAEKSPATFQQALAAACGALKIRPVYLRKQPFQKRAASVRRALSLVNANAIAEEMLAVYFLECRKELLTEWLDLLGVEHEEGILADDEPAQPDAKALEKAIRAFEQKDDDLDRLLLLSAFAAQSAVSWPDLDRYLEDAKSG
ncbi:MAG: hypothetical protein VCB42_04770 [Myxococcota bacterium]